MAAAAAFAAINKREAWHTSMDFVPKLALETT